MSFHISPRSFLKWVEAHAIQAVVLGGLILLSLPAHAVNLVSCTGTESITFSPGATQTPRLTTLTTATSLPLCVHASAPVLMPASGHSQISHSLSCDELANGATGTKVFQWTNGQTSTFSFVSTATTVDGNFVVTLNGTITAGLYQGASAVASTVFTPLLATGNATLADTCNTDTGVTSASGIIMFNVLPF